MTSPETFDVELTDDFPATVAQLFAAWTDGSVLRQWWGPVGFTCPIAEMDVRVGGVSIVAMRAPDEFGGAEFVNSWTYTRVEPDVRLEFESRFVDPDRRPISPAEAGIPLAVPAVVPHVLTFRPTDHGGSRLAVTEVGHPDEATRDQSAAGMAQCLARLQQLLQGQVASDR